MEKEGTWRAGNAALLILVLVGCGLLNGCFDPKLDTGYNCGLGNGCPPGQTCTVGGICCPTGMESCRPFQRDSGVDQSPTSDIASTPDMAAAPDFASPPDLEPIVDLTPTPDLTTPPDLTPMPDMSPSPFVCNSQFCISLSSEVMSHTHSRSKLGQTDRCVAIKFENKNVEDILVDQIKITGSATDLNGTYTAAGLSTLVSRGEFWKTVGGQVGRPVPTSNVGTMMFANLAFIIPGHGAVTLVMQCDLNGGIPLHPPGLKFALGIADALDVVAIGKSTGNNITPTLDPALIENASTANQTVVTTVVP